MVAIQKLASGTKKTKKNHCQVLKVLAKFFHRAGNPETRAKSSKPGKGARTLAEVPGARRKDASRKKDGPMDQTKGKLVSSNLKLIQKKRKKDSKTVFSSLFLGFEWFGVKRAKNERIEKNESCNISPFVSFRC